jgi:hypothetical protein
MTRFFFPPSPYNPSVSLADTGGRCPLVSAGKAEVRTGGHWRTLADTEINP